MNIINSIKRGASKAAFKFKKYSPEICIATGIVVGAVAMYGAVKETLTADVIFDEAKAQLDKVHSIEKDIEEGKRQPKFKDPNTGEIRDYDADEIKRDKFRIYVQLGAKLLKKYAWVIGLYILSIVLELAGFKIIKKHYATMAAYAAGVAESFKKYRENIISTHGKEADLNALFDKKVTSEVKETEDENGNLSVENVEKTEIKKRHKGDEDYCVVFDDRSPLYRDNLDYNIGFLKGVEKFATQKLRTQGHLFLNEVYDALGLPRTATGAVCGWIYSYDDDAEGDNFVSFRTNGDEKRWLKSSFYGQYDSTVNLEFNCQGVIYDKI